METKIKSFTQLTVWKKAHLFVLKTYIIANKFPKEETYGLSGQMKRASVSISSNIAEGFYRRTAVDKAHFYNISLTSIAEVRNQLLIARDLRYITKNIFSELANSSVELQKLLNGLIKSCRDKTLTSP